MKRKKYYHSDEVAELLNCTTSEVYTLLKDGTLCGHKNRGHWLIDMEQPYLEPFITENKPDNDSYIRIPDHGRPVIPA